jgi:hypothetical protein
VSVKETEATQQSGIKILCAEINGTDSAIYKQTAELRAPSRQIDGT